MILASVFESFSLPTIAAVLFLLLMISYVAGQRIRRRVNARLNQIPPQESASVSSTLLGLLALLLAFSFGMANSRFDVRRKLVSDEYNAISTAILRTDIYPDSVRKKLHEGFRKYINARMDYYDFGIEGPQIVEYFDKSNDLGTDIWKTAATYAKTDLERERSIGLLPALNNMLDIASSRFAAHRGKVPDSILYFLIALCLSSTFLLGYESKSRFEWIPITGFCLMLALTIFSILDLDRLHSGLIRLENANIRMAELLLMLNDQQP